MRSRNASHANRNYWIGSNGSQAELLGDALEGETFRFAREDYVLEAWRIVDNVLNLPDEPIEYAPGTWGPEEATNAMVPGGWLQANGA